MKNFKYVIHGMSWSLAVLATALPACSFADPVAVVSSKSPLANASKSEVANLFLGKSEMIGGQHATPVALKDGNPIREAFYMKYTGKSADAASKFFAKQAFTGKASIMEEFATEAEIKSWLVKNDHSVGMIDSASLDATVKEVSK